MSPYVFQVENICKSYNDIQILKSITFSVEAGELLCIIGENASSKTTLIKAISGAIPVDSGNIFIDGRQVYLDSPSSARHLGIKVIHQEEKLFSNLTVAENIYFANYSAQTNNILQKHFGIVNWKKIYNKAKKLCKDYHFNIDVHQKVKTLGMAERQIVSILHALVQDIRILIIDEAFSALDDIGLRKVLNIIKKIRNNGVAIIYITQRLEHIFDISDSVMIIANGAVSEKRSSVSLDTESLISSITACDKYRPYPKLATEKSNEFFRCTNLNYKNIIKDISFNLYKGEILGLVGMMGSGRTTLSRLLFGDLKKDSGDFYLHGQKININSPSDARRHKFALIVDDYANMGLINTANILNNISLANYYRACTNKTRFIINKKKLRNEAGLVADRLGIQYRNLKQDVKELSAGHQEKVMLARWLFAQSQLFVFDEPTRGIDNAGKIQIYNILNELSREGKCVLFITSDIPEAIGMCDRILVLRSYTIVKEFLRQEASYDKIYKYLHSTLEK